MAMAVDNRQQHQVNGLGFDTIRYPGPQFTNPWVSGPSPGTPLYTPSLGSNAPTAMTTTAATVATAAPVRPTTASMPYPGLPVSAPSLGAGSLHLAGMCEPQSSLVMSQDLNTRPFTTTFPTPAVSAAVSAVASYAPTSAPQYAYDYNKNAPVVNYHPDMARRSSKAIKIEPHLPNPPQRCSLNDALDASRGMVTMSQDMTPRSMYGNQNTRASVDAYGFAAPNSANSSISSASTYPQYYNGSVSSVADSSVTDYSSASESIGDMSSRTLPRPSALIGTNLPPAPQSMMGQFSSKVTSSSQKKHKCKVCDKRFTRPSSLQTHMYSHTGQKPFACEVEGCGRHFSVVSNLRRHRKVHKGERDQVSPDEN